MKRIIGLLLALLILDTVFTGYVYAGETDEKAFVVEFLSTVENESEFLLMMQLLCLIEDQDGLYDEYEQLFNGIASTEGDRFDELSNTVSFMLVYSKVILEDMDDYMDLVNAMNESKIDDYVDGLDVEDINEIVRGLLENDIDLTEDTIDTFQLNKITEMLDKTASFNKFGISFPVVTISEDYESSVINAELLDALSRLAGDYLTDGDDVGYEIILSNMVTTYHGYYQEASLKDQKILAAYLYNYGLLTVE